MILMQYYISDEVQVKGMKDGGKIQQTSVLNIILFAIESFRKGMLSTNPCSFEGSNEQNNRKNGLWCELYGKTFIPYHLFITMRPTPTIATEVQHLVVQTYAYGVFASFL